MEEVAFHFNLQYPINLKWYECKTSFEFVIYKNLPRYSFLTSSRKQIMGNRFSSGAPQFFPSSAAICLLSGLPTATVVCSSGQVNLINVDTYRCDSATIIMSSL